MKNKKFVLWLALIVMAIIPVYAQQYNPESDFKIDWDKNVKDGIIITGYVGTRREVSIPPKIQNSPVTGIGGMAFRLSNVTKVIIPNSVIKIEDGFSGADGGYYGAFQACHSLTNITIPNSVTSIGAGTFASCSSLTNVTIPNSVTSIGADAFKECIKITSVTIPNSITTIERNAFAGCKNLTSIIIPNSVTSIGAGAFKECIKITSVTIPNSITTIERNAFAGCENLTSIIIPNSVTSIGAGAFKECIKITIVTFQGTITFGENYYYGTGYSPFDGDLDKVYTAKDGGPGVYTRFAGGEVWKKTQSISQPAAGNLGAFTIRMEDNFQYAQGYEARIVNANLLNSRQITKGETYTLKVTYTASRDLEGPILVRLVDPSPEANWWRDLTPGDDSKFQIPASKAGEVVSVTITLNTIASSTGNAPDKNIVVFTTNGRGIKGTQNSGVQKPFNIVFTEFILTRIK